jgi:hypothetical protein
MSKLPGKLMLVLFSEQIWGIPTYFPYIFARKGVIIGAAPARGRGWITFIKRVGGDTWEKKERNSEKSGTWETWWDEVLPCLDVDWWASVAWCPRRLGPVLLIRELVGARFVAQRFLSSWLSKCVKAVWEKCQCEHHLGGEESRWGAKVPYAARLALPHLA